ncbi:KIDINS220 [Mytilus coruscus]|uniref:KIDINS220 n=1 Tax=Mytilus coruscus TaxID=42192 RepID=A0A6J8EZY5_MYTCO|nr:KIDINS220 [Mytilus coruscus]
MNARRIYGGNRGKLQIVKEAAQGRSPSLEAVVRFDSNSNSVHVQKIVSTLSTDNVQPVGTENICTIDISEIVQEQVQLQVENLLKQKLLDLNANVVQAVDKPISTPLHIAIPHFDKFKSYDEQMSIIESNADQVLYHALEENLDDYGFHSPQSCQMYTCTPVEVPQEAPGALMDFFYSQDG